jgi:hypothetical protein
MDATLVNAALCGSNSDALVLPQVQSSSGWRLAVRRKQNRIATKSDLARAWAASRLTESADFVSHRFDAMISAARDTGH